MAPTQPSGMPMKWPTRPVFVALTLVNLALVLFGLWIDVWIDAGSLHDKALVATALSVMLFPALALICALLPWLFLRMRWRVTAIVTAIVPVAVGAASLLFS